MNESVQVFFGTVTFIQNNVDSIINEFYHNMKKNDVTLPAAEISNTEICRHHYNGGTGCYIKLFHLLIKLYVSTNLCLKFQHRKFNKF